MGFWMQTTLQLLKTPRYHHHGIGILALAMQYWGGFCFTQIGHGAGVVG